MPLIILGLIVVLGACLLIYYQLGPKVTLRLKSKPTDPVGPEGAANPAEGEKDGAEKEGDADKAEIKPKAEDEKVLYIFGDGERLERPLRENDEKDEPQK